MQKIPRGIRNNNPLNIRIGNKWLGEVAFPTDNQFEQFTMMEYGVRAGFLLIKRYIERYHLNTIELIVSRWAPPSENKTIAYIASVEKLSGIPADKELRFYDNLEMISLVDAMIVVECGQHIDLDIINRGYMLARMG